MLSARLVQSGFSDAAANMAVDEAIFLSFKEHKTLPTLRLYGWSPSAFSIGQSQNASDVLDSPNFVRRPTGGGVIFHDNELTYSIVLAQSDIGLSYRVNPVRDKAPKVTDGCLRQPVSYGVKESYENITSFLITAYHSLGIDACFAKETAPQPLARHSIADFCFSRKEEYDIVASGKKIGGNAQKRRRNIILQHGSIPLSLIAELTEKDIGFDQLSDCLIKAFSGHFKTILKAGDLTQTERNLAEKLRIEKYSNPEWNHSRAYVSNNPKA
jgi:lipoate-protein ligase A